MAERNPFGRHLEREERNPFGRSNYANVEQERVRNLSGFRGEAGSFVSAAQDSLSLGFGDEIMGVGAGIGAVARGEDYRSAYQRQVQKSRQRLEDAWRNHAGAAVLGSVAGALPLGFGVGAAARGGAAATRLANLGPWQRIGAAAAGGAGTGAVYGAGSANDDRGGVEGYGGRALGAGMGAGLGALTGGALQGAGMAAGHTWRNMIRPGYVPEERAAQQLGAALERAGIRSPQEFNRRARELQRMERFSPGSNPLVMDALDEAGTGMTMAAATRQSRGRVEMQRALEGRNQGARERVDAMLVRDLGGGQRRTVANAWEELDAIQANEAAPLYANALRRPVQSVPQEMADFVKFNSREGARFRSAVNQARESIRRETGNPRMKDADMFRNPNFWHHLQENVSAEVGAVYRSARMNPLQGPRGTAVAEMVQDDKFVNRAVRKMLGSDYSEAMTKYAGAERLKRAWETGYDAVRLDGGEMDLAGFARQVRNMSASEKEAVRNAAISSIRRDLARADTGTGRSDVLRAIIGNEAKKNTLRAIFGSEARLSRVMRALEYERRLYMNYADTNIARGSPTADKTAANQQMFAPNEIGGLSGFLRRNLAAQAREQYNERMSNSVLDLMRQPLTGPNAPRDIQAYARQQGLLSRALRESERLEGFRRRMGPQAAQMGAMNAIGLTPQGAY